MIENMKIWFNNLPVDLTNDIHLRMRGDYAIRRLYLDNVINEIFKVIIIEDKINHIIKISELEINEV